MGNPLPSQQKGTAEGCEYCSNLYQTGLPFFIGYTNWFSLVAKHTYLILSPHQPQGVKLVASTGNQGQRKYVIPCHPLFFTRSWLVLRGPRKPPASRKMSFLGTGTWPLADIFPAETSTFVTNMRVQPAWIEFRFAGALLCGPFGNHEVLGNQGSNMEELAPFHLIPSA